MLIEEERSLCGDALHVGVLVLDETRHHRIVDVPQQRNPPSLVAVDDPLGRGGCCDHVVGPAQVLGDQLALGQLQRFDEVGGEEAVLGDDAGSESEFGDSVGR